MTTSATRTIKTVLDDAQPSLLGSALAKVLLGTLFTPLKRTFTLAAPVPSPDLTTTDATGETVGATNKKRLAALLVTTARVTLGAVSGVLAGGTDATQAFLDLSGPGSASFDIVVQATSSTVGAAGNGGAITVACAADGVNDGTNGGASMTQVGGAVTLHFISGVTNNSDMERAIARFGAGAKIEIKTHTTNPSYVMGATEVFAATNLAGGVNPTAAELNLATLGTGQDDTVVKYVLTGVFSGNGVRVSMVGDAAAAAGTFQEVGSGATATVTLHYKAATSTVANIETLIGTTSLITVKTAGTGATVVPDLDATQVGPYVVTDAGGATLVPPGGNTVGIAKLSDDGKTITFPGSAVGAFVVTYVPRTLSAAQYDAAFPAL